MINGMVTRSINWLIDNEWNISRWFTRSILHGGRIYNQHQATIKGIFHGYITKINQPK